MHCKTLLMILALIGAPLAGAVAEPFTDAQKQAIREEVKQLLNDNPEVVIDALRAHQQREMQQQQQAQEQALAEMKDTLHSGDAPSIGNPGGDVTIVEFLDYNCGYCKKMHPIVEEVLADDKNLKVIFKDLPVLGESSYMAAKAALAAHQQGKYHALHSAMLESRGGFSEATIKTMAKEAGLDVDQLIKDMDSEVVTQTLATNAAQAQNLQIRGTPAFIINDRLYPGAFPSADAMREMIADVRGGKAE